MSEAPVVLCLRLRLFHSPELDLLCEPDDVPVLLLVYHVSGKNTSPFSQQY